MYRNCQVTRIGLMVVHVLGNWEVVGWKMRGNRRISCVYHL